MASSEEAKLELFLAWLQANGAELRCCEIQYCGPNKGFGIFSSNNPPDGVFLVVPLDLAITPMRVLQDPLIGAECRAMFEEGEVDDRFLIILFLTVERLRTNSLWKPYLDVLPTTFGSPLWFTDDEFSELTGTTLHHAVELQRKQLRSLYEEKVKSLVKKFLSLDGDTERDVSFEDFLWANSIFWTRALNIPLPRSYVFPEKELDGRFSNNDNSDVSNHEVAFKEVADAEDQKTYVAVQDETVWVEGLVPGIDFCNHDLQAVATWEVDATGSTTRVPFSMYLLSAEQGQFQKEKEIRISYGNKGNEELLYLYGFVIDDNPDDYLMVHYPAEAMQSIPFSEAKAQLLEAQKAELRCLLPRSLLDQGFFPRRASKDKGDNKQEIERAANFSWSGQRRTPSYRNKLVFPENFLTALRTIAMKEEQLSQVTHLLEELIGSGEEREPSDTEVRGAVWEACGDSGALQLLVDLLQTKVMNLEEGTGTEMSDVDLLEKVHISEIPENHTKLDNVLREINDQKERTAISRNRWSAIVYRHGQKQLARLFLKEAEHALQLSLSDGN
ncbi:hypothetical protein CRG98_034189 [Punica granatum]|uniref:Uncharacterized protein n=1 Tax=Punica granatum TaxID=22663 RepID=A0A2I0IMZ9_PUNGR|nr:hypothetical protein CRG98_034189 [Punica granatum]